MKNTRIIITGGVERSFGLSDLLTRQGLEPEIVNDDSRSLIEEINRIKPKAVIMPAFMPLQDAVGVINLAKTMRVGEDTFYFVMGSGEGVKTINYIINNGADYYFYMSSKGEAIAEKVAAFFETPDIRPAQCITAEVDDGSYLLEPCTREVLRTAGILPHLKGFSYLEAAVRMSMKNAKGPVPLTKQVYPSIARDFETTEIRVERAIRNAITVAWTDYERRAIKNDNVIFSKCTDKPSNRAFLGLITLEIRRRLIGRREAV